MRDKPEQTKGLVFGTYDTEGIYDELIDENGQPRSWGRVVGS